VRTIQAYQPLCASGRAQKIAALKSLGNFWNKRHWLSVKKRPRIAAAPIIIDAFQIVDTTTARAPDRPLQKRGAGK